MKSRCLAIYLSTLDSLAKEENPNVLQIGESFVIKLLFCAISLLWIKMQFSKCGFFILILKRFWGALSSWALSKSSSNEKTTVTKLNFSLSKAKSRASPKIPKTLKRPPISFSLLFRHNSIFFVGRLSLFRFTYFHCSPARLLFSLANIFQQISRDALVLSSSSRLEYQEEEFKNFRSNKKCRRTLKQLRWTLLSSLEIGE